MKISRVQLKKFKRFDDLTIDVGSNPPRIVALVGPNGCGKSSVFDAFERKLQQVKAATNQRDESFYNKSLYSAEGNPREALSPPDQIRIETPVGPLAVTPISFHVRSAYRFTSGLNVSSISALPNLATDERRAGNSAAIDSNLQWNYERLIGSSYEEFEKGSKTGDQVREELIGEINRVLQSVLTISLSSLGNVTKQRGRLYFNKDDTRDFPYENLSAGEKEVVDLVIDMVVRKEIFRDAIFCIDEPELHLNTAIQRRLLVALESLLPTESQLWIATHSIGFLRALQDELADKCGIIDFSSGDLFKGTHTLRPMETTRTNWQRLFETALDDLVGLVAPTRIVYCEGKAAPSSSGEEAGLDAIVYNEAFAKTHPDTLFVSSGGNKEARSTSSLALTVMSKAFRNTELLLLRDRDLMTEADRSSWLLKENHHRMLQRREIENYLFDFDVLSAYCKDKGFALDRAAYDAIVADIEMQDLKIGNTTQSLKTLCSARGSNEVFKRSLASYLHNAPAVRTLLEKNIF